MLFYIMSAKERNKCPVFRLGNIFLLIQTISLTISVLVLLLALITSNFNLVYVANYTDSALPIAYKLSALWAGQAGSLLFWSFLASAFSAIELWRFKEHDHIYQSYVYIACVFTTTFFLFLCTFITSPFETLDFIPSNGRGMNPMLQNFGMLIHPPLLYLGFVGFMIPCAHAFASACKKDVTNFWIRSVRPWMLITWAFLTVGIVLGGWWAYVELGWGGYWAWDPVENASLFPWITATAFIHASIVYERRNRLKAWSYLLILVTFELTIFGTFLTRSGIMTDSVHSFGSSPLGGFFIFFMLLTIVVYSVVTFSNRKAIDDKDDEFHFFSKEGLFFFAMLAFLALTLALLFYTILPTFSELLAGTKFSVKQDSYNFIAIPFFAAILVFASFAPATSYGKVALFKFIRSYLPVLIIGVIAFVIPFALGYRKPAPLILSFAAAASLSAFVIMGGKAIKKGGISVIWRNRRLFGAIVAHIGLAILAFGVIYSSFYTDSTDILTSPNANISFHGYDIAVGELHHAQGENYRSDIIPLDIYKESKFKTKLFPEIREYSNNDNIFGEVAYHSAAGGDLYFILQGYDMRRNMIRFQILFQPLIIWIWIGCVIMCIGAIYGVSQALPVAKKL
ncbi:MAG: cytochrome c biogenesis protein CcsA [Deferribacteraceae bacterium]|nr:cytochrome c biogenesis protein CcsA [Deferribacteraceae bacterium]